MAGCRPEPRFGLSGKKGWVLAEVGFITKSLPCTAPVRWRIAVRGHPHKNLATRAGDFFAPK
jgi:hypothetical protein